MYSFRNPDGTVRHFGPSAHLRTFRTEFGKAHDLWVAADGRCFHSPGPGGHYHEADLASVLNGVKWLFVVSIATTYEEFQQQLRRARSIAGLPWNLPSANCQHTATWVSTGKASSFQVDALWGLGMVLIAAPLAFAALKRG